MAEFVKTSGANIPDTAIRAGYEANGKSLFVAKATIDKTPTPGKVGFHIPGAHIPYGGLEHIIKDYEVLVHPASAPGFYEWKPASNGEVPPGAVSVTDDLYVGRCNFKGGVHPGKVAKSHNCLYVSYGGKEHNEKNYEVLCRIK